VGGAWVTTEVTIGAPVALGVVVVVTDCGAGLVVVTATGAEVVVVVASGGGGGADTVCGSGSVEHPAIAAETARRPTTPNERSDLSEGEALVVSMRPN
jgi:hypothetical protein